MKKITPKDIERIKSSEFFDEEWYLDQYPDVAMTGLSPAEHYLKYGGFLRRDPSMHFSSSFHMDTRPLCEKHGMNPLLHYIKYKSAKWPQYSSLLWATHKLASKGHQEEAVTLADKYLPESLRYTKEVLLANHSIKKNDEKKWLFHVNNYLGNFGVEPITLSGDGHLLSRLSTKQLTRRKGGSLVTVIMPAWNAEETVRYAAESILNQTWENVELLIVDDASEDSTWTILKELEGKDSRVKIFRNKVNVGPYVSKNRALFNANGDYITGHDADDWAHPQRVENHIRFMEEDKNLRASLVYMIRVQPNGFFGHIGKVAGFSFDGVARKASISCMFERELLMTELGYWDSVRFGADSEMIARVKSLLGDRFSEFKTIGMICLDLETSLTNHSEHGVDKVSGISPIRKQYRDNWMGWHKDHLDEKNAYLDFPLKNRRYEADKRMVVDYDDVVKVISEDMR